MSRKVRSRLAEIVRVVFAGNEKAAADAAGLQPSTVHRILSGHIKNPRPATLEKMADAFGVPVGWLTGEDKTLAGFADEYPIWMLLLGRYAVRRNDAYFKLLPRLQESKNPLAQKLAEAWTHQPGLLADFMQATHARAGKLPESYLEAERARLHSMTLLLERGIAELKKQGVLEEE